MWTPWDTCRGLCGGTPTSCGVPSLESCRPSLLTLSELYNGDRQAPGAGKNATGCMEGGRAAPGPREPTFMIATAIMAADAENMRAGSSMSTAAPTLVWKKPIAASQPLQGARERGGRQTVRWTRPAVLHRYRAPAGQQG